jgi:hypothetical protein
MKFNVVSDSVICSDPCYTGICKSPALNGQWNVQIEYSKQYEGVIANFHAFHKDYGYEKLNLDTSTFDGCVDSAQFGIFDSSLNVGDGEYGDSSRFYGQVCKITQSKNACGIINNLGFVSTSGFGDGDYDIESAFVDNKLVGFKIIFIDENEYQQQEEELD